MSKFSVLYVNARSLLPKIDHLRVACAPDIICIVETWTNVDILNSELCIQGYEIIRLDRNRHGGGILIYVNTRYSHNILYSDSPDLELLIVSIFTTTTPITLALFYRPPSSPYGIFDTLQTTLFSHVETLLLSNFILIGDFNVNYLNNTHPLFSKLHTVTCLTQVVTSPTHCSNSLIDLIFLSSSEALSSCEILPPLANSDHNGILLLLQNLKTKPIPIKGAKKIWRYDYADFNLALDMIAEIDWDSVFLNADVDECWSTWRSIFMHIMDSYIPSSTLKPRKNLPWLTKSIIQLMRKRNALFRAAGRTRTEAAQTKYKRVRNRVVAMLRISKSIYFRNLGCSSQKDFWKAVKLIRREESSIPALKNGPTLATSNSDKALLLNEFFYSCFNDSFRPLTEPTRLDPSKCPPHLLCTEEEVMDLLLSLDPAKSTGPDKISATMLRSTAVLIAPSLTKLFNLSIASGRFPTDWKCARITPIFKSGDSALACNYRPISILPIVSKVLERHIYRVLFDFLATNSPISIHQWGFMPNRSTVSALCTLTHDCLKSLDDGKEICSVYFDLRKAFDTVPHVPLLNKLTNLQLDRHVLTWIQSYLVNRSQVVAVGGVQSSSVPVISGVPQGSVLGPLLFLIYINDVTSLMSAPSKLTLFADDMTLYRTISSPADYIVLQSDITAISTWVAGNHLELNSNKCCFMLISHKRSRSIPPPTLYIDSNTALTQVNSVKYLGIQLTCDLSHITIICTGKKYLLMRRKKILASRNFCAHWHENTGF